MKKRIVLFFILLAFGFVSGCSIVEQRAAKLPGAEIKEKPKFFVLSLEGDKRNIALVISDELEAMGYESDSGLKSWMPPDTDVLVTFEDRWFWDMANYMIRLNMEFRDPVTEYPLVVGESLRTSLARKSPPEMAREVLTGMFAEYEKN
ncbi:MAG: hypothetical protein JXK94_03820 [Deltaproteobacteria bacterium]|nr:hypothetical protein [Deltaproteobacteria bacterium]